MKCAVIIYFVMPEREITMSKKKKTVYVRENRSCLQKTCLGWFIVIPVLAVLVAIMGSSVVFGQSCDDLATQ